MGGIPTTQAERNTMVARWLDGENQYEIAERMHRNQTTVSDAVRRALGVTAPERWIQQGARRFAKRLGEKEPKTRKATVFVPPTNPPRLVLGLCELFPGEAEAFWARVGLPDSNGCRHWQQSTDDKGYGQYWNGKRGEKAHRAAWRLTYGPIPEDKQINHRCDVRDCCEPEHHFLGTQSDNNKDMAAKERTVGKHPDRKADKNYNANLNWETVREIRRLRTEGWSTTALARHFGISRASVGYIIRGEQWSTEPE